jgi:hypothetical protein
MGSVSDSPSMTKVMVAAAAGFVLDVDKGHLLQGECAASGGIRHGRPWGRP